MAVEIHGAGFENKGAELMLRTVVSELRNRIPDIQLAIDTTYGTYESRINLGLKQTFPPRVHVGTPGFSKKLFKQKLFSKLKTEKLLRRFINVNLSSYGCVSLLDVEGLIDIAGFAYTDEWGSQPTKDFAELTDYYRSRHKPVILLPQAFGPFQKEETKVAFQKIVKNANLIFPRDKQSYDYVMNLCPSANNVFQMPDITLFYPSYPHENLNVSSNYVCIVPNCRMLDQGKDRWESKYESYLIKMAKEAIHQGLKIKLIIHDTSGKDLYLAQGIYEQINSAEVTLVNELNPLELKKLIGNSLFLIGSRYHSLVASFSKNVPAIALGWSHKYEMLFQDFNCEQFLVSHDTSEKKVLELVQQIGCLKNNLNLRKQIAEQLVQMSNDNQKMWNMVVDLIKKNT